MSQFMNHNIVVPVDHLSCGDDDLRVIYTATAKTLALRALISTN